MIQCFLEKIWGKQILSVKVQKVGWNISLTMIISNIWENLISNYIIRMHELIKHHYFLRVFQNPLSQMLPKFPDFPKSAIPIRNGRNGFWQVRVPVVPIYALPTTKFQLISCDPDKCIAMCVRGGIDKRIGNAHANTQDYRLIGY